MKITANGPQGTMHDQQLGRWRRSWLVLTTFGLPLLFLLGLTELGQSVPPGLKITPLGNGDLQISITNATPSDAFEIYHTPTLDPGFVWNLNLLGYTGQSNFTISAKSSPSGFYRALNGSDLDSDGIPNFKDANPTNAAIGLLTVIIETPANGSVVY